MRIYSMTATFGKLEHQTLTLQPGLNIIEAPNEWGKSTWCAFLVNMLYGIDTRARSTGAALADKERYAPWSGSPMSGRIDLNWNGRDITIERSTRGRVLFGEFKAYETQTGLEIPELNSLNCGQMLLGVERGVFTRAGFLKHADLPVTHDDSLRRRLNNLVTTGDESDSGDKLAQKLKDLKNKCRHNRTGLLPQAETEREQLQSQLQNLHELTQRIDQLREVRAQLEGHIAQLENHADALRYAASLDDRRRVEEALAAAEQAKQRLEATMDACRELPSQDDAKHKLQTSQVLQEQWMALQAEARMLPPMPEPPQIPAWYKSVEAAMEDVQHSTALENSKKKNMLIFGICFILAAAAAVCAILLSNLMPYMIIAAAAILVSGIALCSIRASRIHKALLQIYDRYPGIPAKDWISQAQKCADQLHAYQLLCGNATALRADVDARTAAVQDNIAALTDGDTLSACQTRWAQTVAAWEALADARRDLAQTQSHAQTLQAMVKTVEPPKEDDTLTYPAEQTQAILTEARAKLQEINNRLGQCQGQAEAVGSEAQLRARLDTLNRRIARLEDTYYALELAQDALHNATQQLQRRFAPRISKRAQELFAQLTDGRYQRLTLGSDFSISTSAVGENTLYSAQWRSDGTADQLYFALRLAVSEELTPEAPLVLDDALVCFDETRLKAAMDILQEASQNKQVILFTCQGREKLVAEAK